LLPELLMPAGNFEKMCYAFAYGADAVYAGVPKYSLRARENQFRDEQSLCEALDYAHKRGKKVYLTTNILPHNSKIDGFLNSLDALMDCRPDAFITADPGLIRLMHRRFPQIEIHLSVQANCVNWASARFWYEQGVKRIILSRELSISEIAEIHARVPEVELEAFVHGSICIAYSGRCLLSNYFNHRDANQGTCTNSCRWGYQLYGQNGPADDASPQYRPVEGQYFLEQSDRSGELMPVDEDEYGTYIMNAKDLMALPHLRELQQAGVMSFKVEGRSKSIYYVARIASIYRRAIAMLEADDYPIEPLLAEVEEVANRGYTTGFLTRRPQQYGINYTTARPRSRTLRYAARVGEFDRQSGCQRIDVRNKIKVGDELTLIRPGGDNTKLTITELFDRQMQPVREISGGIDGAAMRVREALPANSLLAVPT
jgi:putative protease